LGDHLKIDLALIRATRAGLGRISDARWYAEATTPGAGVLGSAGGAPPGGMVSYNNRVKQGKSTSYFDDAEQAERATREAWEKGTPTRPDGKAREFDFGRRVGTGPNGGGQTRVKTHMDDNGMIHGHPSGPESP
jgi:hypothetical protein